MDRKTTKLKVETIEDIIGTHKQTPNQSLFCETALNLL